ncbi:MAG: hypothetical protein M3415_07275 [Actinomycetota bacterium]|nr:hypothetical protein [Actinomycetota bacterium]
MQVWGCARTPEGARDAALTAAAGWVGLHDDPSELDAVVDGHPLVSQAVLRLGEVRLSRMPRVCEALGRSVLEQLVQTLESHRSIAQLVSRTGTAATASLWCWPTPAQLGSTPAWSLRRCGVSLRSAGALHAACVADVELERARRLTLDPSSSSDSGRTRDPSSSSDSGRTLDDAGWAKLDQRLRTLPGVGAWTSAETRLRLGDPDAVSVGDYHLPTVIGRALGGENGDGPGGAWTDAGMLQLLQPFAGQRGRVIRLIERAAYRGLVPRARRRAPRAPLSAHRYW